MDFSPSKKVVALQETLAEFLEQFVVPRIADWNAEVAAGAQVASFLEDLKSAARRAGLWNLFLPGLRNEEPGTRLTNLEYAPLAEMMGRIPWSAEIFNCSAPDTGNMELLHLFATPDQRERWLNPLLDGTIRSAFAMTEPDVASSDATNIQTSIVRSGDDYVINGRKWYITNVAHPHCSFLIVMGKTDPNADRHRQQSMVIVPRETPGVRILRNIPVLHHVAPHGHCEILLRDVRVPHANLLGSEGGGFEMAQARLGPGRVHHCMRAIGQAELALQLMVERSKERMTFGRQLHAHGVIAEWIAESRAEIEQARLLVLKTAWMLDHVGAAAARMEIALIKVAVPAMQQRVTDRAIQVFGAMGTGPDTPLAEFAMNARALRIADGPDEVHKRAIAKFELSASRVRSRALAAYLTPLIYSET